MVGQKHSWSMISEASWRSGRYQCDFVSFLPIYRSDREFNSSVRVNSSDRPVVFSDCVFRCMQNLLIAVSPRGFFTALDTKEFRWGASGVLSVSPRQVPFKYRSRYNLSFCLLQNFICYSANLSDLLWYSENLLPSIYAFTVQMSWSHF